MTILLRRDDRCVFVVAKLTTRVLFGVKNGPLSQSPVRFKYKYRRPKRRTHTGIFLQSLSNNHTNDLWDHRDERSRLLHLLQGLCHFPTRNTVAEELASFAEVSQSKDKSHSSQSGMAALSKSYLASSNKTVVFFQVSRPRKPGFIPSGCPTTNAGIYWNSHSLSRLF